MHIFIYILMCIQLNGVYWSSGAYFSKYLIWVKLFLQVLQLWGSFSWFDHRYWKRWCSSPVWAFLMRIVKSSPSLKALTFCRYTALYLYESTCAFSNLAFNRIFFHIFSKNTAFIRVGSHMPVQRWLETESFPADLANVWLLACVGCSYVDR